VVRRSVTGRDLLVPSYQLLAILMNTILIAVGGNSLIRAGEKGTVAEQSENARRTAAAIIGLIRGGSRMVITHGNGPQVGASPASLRACV